MTQHLALIEWDSSQDPEILAGPTWLAVAAAAARRISDPEVSEPPSDWRTVREELPLTPEIQADEELLLSWHADFRSDVTVPWVSFFVLDPEDSHQAVGPDGVRMAEQPRETRPCNPAIPRLPAVH